LLAALEPLSTIERFMSSARNQLNAMLKEVYVRREFAERARKALVEQIKEARQGAEPKQIRRHGRSRLSAPAGFFPKRRRFKTALSACSSRVRHPPQAARGFEWLKPVSRPPIPFLGGTVQFAMMRVRRPFILLVMTLTLRYISGVAAPGRRRLYHAPGP
jgi:hypothetical protein